MCWFSASSRKSRCKSSQMTSTSAANTISCFVRPKHAWPCLERCVPPSASWGRRPLSRTHRAFHSVGGGHGHEAKDLPSPTFFPTHQPSAKTIKNHSKPLQTSPFEGIPSGAWQVERSDTCPVTSHVASTHLTAPSAFSSLPYPLPFRFSLI